MSQIFIIYKNLSLKDFYLNTRLYYNKRQHLKNYLPRKKIIKGKRLLRFINFL